MSAGFWYQQHLGASLLTGRTSPAPPSEPARQVVRGPDRTFPALEQEGTFRTPSGGVAFGDVWLPWYMRQGDQLLVSTLGNLYDHIALSVTSLDAWMDKLRKEEVTFLNEPYTLGDTRAVMIAGPSQEAIELVEVQE